MDEIIKTIITQIPSGVVFDTHTIIEYLFQNNFDDYLSGYSAGGVLAYHGRIGKIIDMLDDGKFISRVGESWSMNVHKNFSICTCWKRNS
ncbi:MAG: hypothetical protein Ta2B_16240 [Termitinemataceae bacterium]|nr:MAG: hypothetical protein Ta2B_16240 [Termitinemataceae bacterium]